jgi:hypothetical protein
VPDLRTLRGHVNTREDGRESARTQRTLRRRRPMPYSPLKVSMNEGILQRRRRDERQGHSQGQGEVRAHLQPCQYA